jgi:hypothetical protein
VLSLKVRGQLFTSNNNLRTEFAPFCDGAGVSRAMNYFLQNVSAAKSRISNTDFTIEGAD